ncbi:chemotaxis protein CheD [Oscillospiraceae bacterium OttesenSCG-928-G22]|nr:chemotaxis protein CheD [Oscillospiraceae bacterium OttesenSCG-928-G22]
MSNKQEDIVKTFALATCVGLVFYSMRARVLGMAHIQLPNSKTATDRNPARYADAAPGYMLSEMTRAYGLTKGEILVSLYGGISGRSDDYFRIGEKNVGEVKRALARLGLAYSDVDTGGNDSRTLIAYVSSGIVEVIRRPMNPRGVPGNRF